MPKTLKAEKQERALVKKDSKGIAVHSLLHSWNPVKDHVSTALGDIFKQTKNEASAKWTSFTREVCALHSLDFVVSTLKPDTNDLPVDLDLKEDGDTKMQATIEDWVWEQQSEDDDYSNDHLDMDLLGEDPEADQKWLDDTHYALTHAALVYPIWMRALVNAVISLDMFVRIVCTWFRAVFSLQGVVRWFKQLFAIGKLLLSTPMHLALGGGRNSLTDLLWLPFSWMTPLLTLPSLHMVHMTFPHIGAENMLMDATATLSDDSIPLPRFYLCVDEAQKRIVLCVQGMADDEDNLGQGFSVAAKIEEKVTTVIESALKKFPDFKLLVTGHSLGADLVNLLCFRFAQWVQRERLECFSFAAPCVASQQMSLGTDCVTLVGLAPVQQFLAVAGSRQAAFEDAIQEKAEALETLEAAKDLEEDITEQMIANNLKRIEQLERSQLDAMHLNAAYDEMIQRKQVEIDSLKQTVSKTTDDLKTSELEKDKAVEHTEDVKLSDEALMDELREEVRDLGTESQGKDEQLGDLSEAKDALAKRNTEVALECQRKDEELKKTKEALKQTNETLTQTKEELKQTKEKLAKALSETKEDSSSAMATVTVVPTSAKPFSLRSFR